MSGVRHFKETKEYRKREKIKCSYCPARGRDVQTVLNTKGITKPLCKNCRGKLEV